MKKITVTKLSVGSFAKTVGAFQATFAFVIGVFVSFATAAGLISESTSFVKTLGLSLWVFGLGIIVYPIVAFFIGWVQGAIGAVILNFIFLESGGIRMHVDEEK
jgi:hypothetical protein